MTNVDQCNEIVISMGYKCIQVIHSQLKRPEAMQAPVDYPVSEDAAITSHIGPMTYAALFERHDAEKHITDDMIYSATRSMEAAQQFPFAARPKTINTNFTAPARSEAVLSRLLKVIR